MKFDIGPQVVAQYKRANYQPWFAIGEFVDNSTQSYLNNKAALDEKYAKRGESLEVHVTYDNKVAISIEDNAMGMDEEELDAALFLGNKPQNDSWRSKYGFGMKAAAFWFGDEWEITTKKLGSDKEITVRISLDKIAKGALDLEPKYKSVKDLDQSYTVIKITKLNQMPHGRTLGKMREYLQSMYRVDLREGRLKLYWRNELLVWETGDIFAKAADGSEYRKDIAFEIKSGGKKKKVEGWVGVLDRGSREKGGFSLLHADRMVKGYPEAWRPGSIYGEQEGGSNNLITQRLVGELHLNQFMVTVSKDGIQWLEDEQDQVEEKLREECADYINFARVPKKDRPVSPLEMKVASEQMNEEINSAETLDAIRFSIVQDSEVIKENNDVVISTTAGESPDFAVEFNDGEKDISIKGFIKSNLSTNDPYVYQESARPNEVIVVINGNHPHLGTITGADNLTNYLRHCTYDAIAEWKALRLQGRVDSATVRKIKDDLLRIGLNIRSE